MASDPQWSAWVQTNTTGGDATNPFVTTTSFTTVFASHPDLAGLSMQDVIEVGQGGTAAQKAARALVASYLDSALYDGRYAYTEAQLKSLWQQAVTTNTPDAFDALKTTLEATYT